MMLFKDAFKFDYDYIHERIQDLMGKFDEDSAFARPSPDMNHAAWLLGHITWCEDTLVAEVPYGKSYRNKEWDNLFDFDSKKLDRDKYPKYREICDNYNKVHSKVTEHFEGLTEKSFSELTVYNGGHYSRLSFLVHFIEEGSTHVGQLQYLAKFLRLR
jgi:hypothetical protein